MLFIQVLATGQGNNRAVRGTLAYLDNLFFYVYHKPAQYFLFGIIETEQGLNWAVARLAQAYILCSPCDQPSYFFFVKMSPVYFFWRIPNPGLLIFLRPDGLQLFQDAESFIWLAEKMAYQ